MVSSMGRKLLIALGGNAIKRSSEAGTTEEQMRNVAITCRQVVKLIQRQDEEDRIAITHGNGPQVGNLLVQQEAGSGLVPAQAFDIVGSMSQGQIGYMFQQTLQNFLAAAGGRMAKIPVLSVVNQVLVSPEDPEFLDPTKPIGNFFSKEEAEKLAEEQGYVINPPAGRKYLKEKRTGFVIKQVVPTGAKPKPFRRVVPSPDPIENVEGEAIRRLVDMGVVVVASGGGGIPVTQRPVRGISVEDAERYLEEGHFLRGSMGPKVEACIRFIRWGGKRAIISSLDKVVDAVDGRAGTHIHP
jgi:carbamate kinase